MILLFPTSPPPAPLPRPPCNNSSMIGPLKKKKKKNVLKVANQSPVDSSINNFGVLHLQCLKVLREPKEEEEEVWEVPASMGLLLSGRKMLKYYRASRLGLVHCN